MSDTRPMIVSSEKQYELMYVDAVQVSYEVKRAVFDLSRWIVTLQGLVIGFSTVKEVQVSQLFIAAPILIGAVGALLQYGFQKELNSHRRTLAELRHKIGGHVAELHSDHIQAHLFGKMKRLSYWRIIQNGHMLVVLGATLVATLIVYDTLY